MKIRFIFILLSFSIAFVLTPYLVVAAESNYEIKIKRKKNSSRIQNLIWSSKDPEVAFEIKKKGYRPYFQVDGKFKRQYWSLTTGKEAISISSDGEFSIKVPVRGERTPFELLAIGPKGEVEKEKIYIVFNQWKEYLQENTVEKRFYYSVGIGLSLITHQATGSTDLKIKAITPKAGISYNLFPPHWSAGVSIFGTGMAFTDDSSRSIRYFGANFRVGYKLPFVKPPFRVRLLAGWYYTTTISSSGAIIYKNLAGPQFFPMIEYLFDRGKSLLTYFKVSPIADRLTILSLESREFAGGLSYSFPYSYRTYLSLSLDFASLKISISGTTINANSTSFGIGYSF